MIAENINTTENSVTLMRKVSDYAQFVKMRLASLVVLSAAISFVIGSNELGEAINWTKMLMLILGGFLVTGSSNGFNQIIEKNLDKLMARTQNRPLPKDRMGFNESFILASILVFLLLCIVLMRHYQVFSIKKEILTRVKFA